MTKELLVSSSPHETKVAVLEDDQLVEVYFQRDLDSGLVGGIYKGRVNRVLPGMQSAFVDIGLERDAFLYVSDFFEDSEEYDRVFTDAENRVAKATGESTAEPSTSPATTVGNAADSAPQPSYLNNAQSALNPEQSSAPVASVAPVNTRPVVDQPMEETSSAPAESGQEQRQPHDPRHDSPGRRHRRRGRGMRENRFSFRRAPEKESFEKPHPPASETRPLEPLPGETLARYSQPAPQLEAENSQFATRPEQESAPFKASDNVAKAPIFQVPVEKQGEQLSNAEAASSESITIVPLEPAPDISPDETHVGLQPALPQREVAGPEHEPAGRDVQPDGEPAPNQQIQAVAEEVESATESEEFAAGSLEEAENGEENEGALPDGEEEPRDVDIGDAAGETDIPADLEQAPEPSQTYTVRDSPGRPRVLPKRGRKGGGRGRFRGQFGRKPETGGAERSRAGNNQPTPINELLKEGQEILVQIAKEPLGTKGARITSHIALPGRYLVYMPTITHIGVSRKIGSDEERFRLRNIILENRGSLTGGFIVRTAGAGKSEEELKSDLAFLTNLWNEIRARADRGSAPALIHRDLTLVERILRDLLSPDFKSVRVDNEIEYEHVLEFVNRFQPALIGHVKLYTRDEPLFEEFGAQAEIDKALKPKVWLKSGGYIVINQTEALVAIDVNTGKYVGKTNRLEDTIVKTNIDAVMEIVRQIRLRDLGGIIVIDFIDMDERRNRMKVVQALEDALRRDRAPTKILSFNEFGLVALTRKRAKQSLERTLCEPCSQCAGAGWVKSVATVSNEIVSEARKMASQIEGKSMTVRVHPQVAANLKSKNGVLISEIEASSRKDVTIKSDPTVSQERFEIF